MLGTPITGRSGGLELSSPNKLDYYWAVALMRTLVIALIYCTPTPPDVKFYFYYCADFLYSAGVAAASPPFTPHPLLITHAGVRSRRRPGNGRARVGLFVSSRLRGELTGVDNRTGKWRRPAGYSWPGAWRSTGRGEKKILPSPERFKGSNAISGWHSLQRVLSCAR